MSRLSKLLSIKPAAPSPVAGIARRDIVEAGELPLALIIVTVAVVSGVSLAFEVLLTRLFSILFQYHYVFVATSVAICGLGLGGAAGAWLTAHRGRLLEGRELGRVLLALALVLTADALLLARLMWAGSVYLHALLALAPYLLIGLFLSSVFARRPQDSPRLYAADLLGAAVGTVAVLPLISLTGVFAAILWLAALSLLPALALLRGHQGRLGGVAMASGAFAIAALLLAQRTGGLLTLDMAGIRSAAPDKTLVRVLQDPSQQARIVETVWSPFARLDVVETRQAQQKLIFTDGGAGSYMYRLEAGSTGHVDQALAELSPLKEVLEFVPFTIGSNDDILVLGAGAGRDIVLALLAGGAHITAVEINPAMVDLVRRYAAYNGAILDRPKVTTVVADGRSFVEQTQAHYDLIYLNVVYSQAAGHEGAALSESYIFTEEALRAYWRRLKPGGRIGIVTHNGFEGSRALLTAIAALQAEGLGRHAALDRVVLTQYGSDDPAQRTSVLLVTRDALSQDALAQVAHEAERRGMQPLYLPYFFELTLRDLVLGRGDVYTFARNGDVNLAPTSDDRPFFYHLDWRLPPPLATLLAWVAAVVLLYAAATLWGVRRAARAVPGSMAGSMAALTLYFGVLGVAYMLILLPLVQRFFLLFGNPTLSLVVTLEGLLIGAGLGSFVSGRRHTGLTGLVGLAAVGIVALATAHAFAYPALRDQLLGAPLAARIGAALLLTLPLGFLLGIPFPTGLRVAGQTAPHGLPMWWGLNAVASVLGSALASVVAIRLGFRDVLLLGAALYALIPLLLRLANPPR